MGNQHSGDVNVEIGGKPFTLRFSVDAICQVEQASGKTFVQIATEMQSGQVSVTMARFLLWGALREHHPDIVLKQAGEMMTALGGLEGALLKISDSMAAAFPEVTKEGDARPQMPGQVQDGTGSAS